MRSLSELRDEIDTIDKALLELFARRMEVSREVALAKIATGKAVFDPVREREKLEQIAKTAPRGLESQATALFTLLMELSKEEQQRVKGK